MIIIRETFIAKPGMASKLAKVLKEASELLGEKSRVMTDVAGRFNKVVMETELESLEALEKRVQNYATSEEVKNKMAGYTDMYQGGKREIYRIV